MNYFLTPISMLFSYNKLAGAIQKLAYQLAKLNAKDPFRLKMTDQLMDKLYAQLSPIASRMPIPVYLRVQATYEALYESTYF